MSKATTKGLKETKENIEDFDFDQFKPKGFDFKGQARQFLYDYAPNLDDEDFDEAMNMLEQLAKLYAESEYKEGD